MRLRTIWRALFPKRILTHRSNQADIGYLFFNVFVFGVVFGWAVLSYQFISNGIIAGLVALFGPVDAVDVAGLTCRASIITVMLFLAYELGYWFNHWLSHKVPLLWEFHKVHHTAEVLTPLTNFRVHPVYTWIFANILAFSAAIANGLRQLHVRRDRLSIRAHRHQHHPGAVHPRLRPSAALAYVDFVPRRARAHLRLARRIIRCITRPIRSTSTRISAVAWRCGTGCSARSTCRKRSASRSPSAFPDHPDAHTVKGELVDPLIKAAGHLKPLWPKRRRQRCPQSRLPSASGRSLIGAMRRRTVTVNDKMQKGYRYVLAPAGP